MMTVTDFYGRFSGQLDRIVKDTRSIGEGDIYLALKGDRFDGNDFVDEAFRRGASYVISDLPGKPVDERIIQVKDGFLFLKELALHHRRQMKAKVIAVTGSNGKTTTKELLYHIFRACRNALATKGNYNNQIGVPLTLLNLKPEHEFLILEMGANKTGDINELCALSEPDFGLITNIGKAHLEGFGGMEGVLRTKLELFEHLKGKKLRMFLNVGSEMLRNMVSQFEEAKTYGPEGTGAEYAYELEQEMPELRMVQISPCKKGFHSKLFGRHNFENVMAAVTVAEYFGLDDTCIQKGLDDYLPDNMRSQIISFHGNKVILDAYNANPTSMAAALDALEKMEGDDKWVILGMMAELGSYADQEHKRLVDGLGEKTFSRKILIGREYQFASAGKDIQWFENVESCRKWLDSCMPRNACILIKGSRSAGLEKLVVD